MRFQHPIEPLERRRLLATQINFADFSNTANLVANGFGSVPVTSDRALRLTRNVTHEARSVWFKDRVPVEQFRTDFSFVTDPSATSADGLTFTIQNVGTQALGRDGNNLGYGGIPASEAVAFNLYNGGAFGSKFGFASDGEAPPTNTDMSPIDLHNGHRYLSTITYDGSVMNVAVSDAADRSKVFTAKRNIDLPAAIGSDTAFVGFTGATGNNISVQDITSWTFAGEGGGGGGGGGAPTVATAASASPNPITSRTTDLSVLGADDGGEQNLTYRWSVVRKPGGARDPIFSDNDTNAAKAVNARFFKDGSYRLRNTITDAGGNSTSSDVVVRVDQTARSIRVTPHAQVIPVGTSVDYDAAVLDQFNRPLRTQPDVTFSLPQGNGTIDADSGLFSATGVGHAVIQAAAGSLTGVAGATVASAAAV